MMRSGWGRTGVTGSRGPGGGAAAGRDAYGAGGLREGGVQMKVFVVEDSSAVRERLVEIINEINGLCVSGEADTCAGAVSGILRAQPDVGIFDIQLAEGSGIDALAEVKRALPALRTIVMSNYATPQHMRAAAAAGAEYFLDKSAEFERIGEILSLMLSERESG
jgi:DNA-binding NarL/FixJ family response regulator